MTICTVKQVEHHHCYAGGCPRIVPPDRLMCGRHWNMVPAEIRSRVNRAFRQGQCERSYPNMLPTQEWVEAARAAVAAIEGTSNA